MKTKILSLAIFLLLFSSTAVHATLLTLDHGTQYSSSYDYGGMGSGRGIGFTVNETFTSSSIGINISNRDNGNTLFEYDIYQSNSSYSGLTLLQSILFTTNGDGFQDQSFAYIFNANSSYVINFKRQDNSWLSGVGTLYEWAPSSYFNYGILTTGGQSEGSNFINGSNPLSAEFRIGVGANTPRVSVPEPASIALLAMGLFGFVASRRKKNQA